MFHKQSPSGFSHLFDHLLPYGWIRLITHADQLLSPLRVSQSTHPNRGSEAHTLIGIIQQRPQSPQGAGGRLMIDAGNGNRFFQTIEDDWITA